MRSLLAAVARRPRLWVTALVTVGHLARSGWWHRWPLLPLPEEGLWAFRMETAYGRPDADPPVGDLVAYLQWCRRGAVRDDGGVGGSVGAGIRVGPAKFQG